MILSIVGAFLLLLGLFSGGVLVAAPLGLIEADPGLVLWLLFPAFSITGSVLFMVGARHSQMRGMNLAASLLLVLLALVSAGALVVQAAGVVTLQGGTLGLWYVLGVAGLLGIPGVAAHGRRSDNGDD